MSEPNSANFGLLVSRSAARGAIRDALRLFVGRGCRYSVKQLGNATGVPDRLIECAIVDPESTDYRPLSLEALASIARFLGSGFTNEWMPVLMGQGAYDLPDSDDPEPAQIAADSADDTATLARAAADGEFKGHEEMRQLRIVGQRKIERGKRLVAISNQRAA